jgi:hypothetical protein
MSATLRLTRRTGGIAYARSKWPITVDGNLAGSIGHGETAELEIDPGRHTLSVGSNRHLSPERTFEATEGETVSFRCRGKFGLAAYLIALLKPDFWIWLDQE